MRYCTQQMRRNYVKFYVHAMLEKVNEVIEKDFQNPEVEAVSGPSGGKKGAGNGAKENL